MATIADIQERLELADFPVSVMESSLKRAQRDFRGMVFEADDNGYDEIEAVACKAIYYLAPMLWQKVQERANEFNETLQTFGDLEVFQNYWLERSESIPVTSESTGKIDTGGIKCRAV